MPVLVTPRLLPWAICKFISHYCLKYFYMSLILMMQFHRKHTIEQEKQWDFLKELTAKISDVTADQEEEEAGVPKRGRYI